MRTRTRIRQISYTSLIPAHSGVHLRCEKLGMSNFSLVPPIRPGMWVRTRAFFPKPLPKGLPADSEVEVLRADPDGCLVRDINGREWLVDLVSLDPGHYIWVDGHWEPERERKVG